ncbi:MAG: GTPase Era [Actinobacteria bacterium]|nr:GTPase Era [Actinomycetota bacterium]
MQEVPQGFKSGFASIVGRPNVGKSTLLNRLVGSKVAIMSNKPQTTRNAIRGILNLESAQVIFIDTPGLHKPKTPLGQRLNAVVRRTYSEVDVVVFVLDASEGFGKGDAFISTELERLQTPVICVINKADRTSPPQLMQKIEEARGMGSWHDVLTTSATLGTGLSDLVTGVVDLLPEGPMYYPSDAVTDQPEALVVAELVREKVIELTREELPHSVAVIVDEMGPREESDLIDIHANVFVERSSQKGIVIGNGGKMLKEIGTRARKEIEALLGSRVFLDLRVKVEPNWQRRQQLLDRLGY